MKHQPKTLKHLKEAAKPIVNANDSHVENLKLTDKIALWITNKVGTFPFFIFTICLSMSPFMIPSLMPAVQFISSAFLQLILLPLIMIGQNLQSKHSEERADATYNATIRSEENIENVHKHLENQNEVLEEILKKLK